MWYNSKFFKYSVKILLVLLILSLSFYVLPYFAPIFNFVRFLFSCLLLGIVLYYLFRPLVRYLTKKKVPFPVTITGIFLFLFLILLLVSLFIIPKVLAPIAVVADAPREKAEEVKAATIGFLSAYNLYSYEEIRTLITTYFLQIQQYIFQNAYGIFSAITHIATILVLTPFTLFYFLKDDADLHRWFVSCIPNNYRSRVETALEHFDEILLSFFHGQITIASIVTLMALIGLYVIGLENVVFITFITFLLSLIPFLGTLLAIIPAVLQGLATGYSMAILAGVIMTCIHLTEANIITPQVMRRRMDIHPLMIIILIITSFTFFGITGPLWITPFYVLIRELLIDIYEFYGWEEDLEK